MSIVTIQVGQCGNQLGESLFSSLSRDLSSAAIGSNKRGQRHRGRVPDGKSQPAQPDNGVVESYRRCFFRDDGVARAVIVDTEPKAIQRIIEGSRGPQLGAEAGKGTASTKDPGARVSTQIEGPKWSYDPSTQVCCRGVGGAANNWAFGYRGYGPSSMEATLEIVRQEVERCDHLAGVSILHSAAGGTGSGLGTYITEALRDHLPSTFLLNAVVCAHNSGEVILQNYNTLFTLSHLAACSDGVLVIENEGASAVCRELLQMNRPSLSDLNAVICDGLTGVLLPATTEIP
ncbi:unnamed protein product, partial [Discosporangium mesarthrocarpum]